MAFMAEKIASFIYRENKILILSFFYFLFRIVNLTLLPIFNDEGIYLDWGYKSLHISNNLFYSLFDAKQPLLIWIFGIFQLLFSDPLFAGRIVSVLFGFITLLGIYNLAKEFYNSKVAIFAVIFYIVIPLFSFFDRQTLMESAMSSIYVWSGYLFLKFQKEKLIKFSLLLGIVLGIGFLIKTNSLIFFCTALLISLFNAFYSQKNRRHWFKHIFIFSAAAIAISSILFTQESFWQTLYTNNRYSLTVKELINFPFLHWFENIKNLIEIGFWFVTPGIFLLGLIGIIALSKSKTEKFLLFWFLINFVFLILLTRDLNIRYIVSFLPFFCIFAAFAIYKVLSKQNFVGLMLFCGSIIGALVFTFQQLFFPISYFSNLSKLTIFSQKSEYVTDWPSGYGISETVKTLEDLGKNQKIYVGIRYDFGNPESAMHTYFNKSKNIRVAHVSRDALEPWIPEDELCIKSNIPFYYVARETQLAGLEKLIKEGVKKIYKPERKSYIVIYKLKTCEKRSRN